MFYIDTIDQRILALLEAREISPKDLLLGAFCDRNREYQPAPVYLFATASELLMLEGTWESEELPTVQNSAENFN